MVNITSYPLISAYNLSNGSMSTLGMYMNVITNGLAAPVMVAIFFVVSYAYMINSAYREHSLAAACFLSTLVSFLFMAGGFLHPIWFLVYVILFAISMYGAAKVGNQG